MYERLASQRLAGARLDTPVILLAGARQVGKSTLAQAASRTLPGEPIRIRSNAVQHSRPLDRFVSFDDAVLRAAATADPQGFTERYRHDRWIVFDEVQRVPQLLIAIKHNVDLDRRPGRFLLTGSADIMMIPTVAESLAGRLEIIPIWPLAQAEIESVRAGFIEHAFASTFPQYRSDESAQTLSDRALRGGYPEPLQRMRQGRRDAWFGNYLTTVVQREITSISAIEDTTAIVRVLRALASRSGGPRNLQTLATDAALPATTLTRYIALLTATFLIHEIAAWSNNTDARIMKSPKLLVTDSGLYGYLLGITSDVDSAGFLIETFVGCELHKLVGWADDAIAVMHFRDARGNEVDFVLERRDRRIVGIEVKRSRSIGSSDFRGLRKLADLAGNRFVRGIILYGGTDTLSFGDRLLAVPISALWTNPS